MSIICHSHFVEELNGLVIFHRKMAFSCRGWYRSFTNAMQEALQKQLRQVCLFFKVESKCRASRGPYVHFGCRIAALYMHNSGGLWAKLRIPLSLMLVWSVEGLKLCSMYPFVWFWVVMKVGQGDQGGLVEWRWAQLALKLGSQAIMFGCRKAVTQVLAVHQLANEVW